MLNISWRYFLFDWPLVIQRFPKTFLNKLLNIWIFYSLYILFKCFWRKKMPFSRWLPTSDSAFSQSCSTFEILKTPFYSKVFLKQDNVIPIWLPISNSAFSQNLKSKVFETNCSIFETLKPPFYLKVFFWHKTIPHWTNLVAHNDSEFS